MLEDFFYKVKVKLIHWKIRWFHDKELETKGKMIPCLYCGKLFKSYYSYSGGGLYTALCSYKCVYLLTKDKRRKERLLK